jgi:hypothetical protein
VTVIFESFAHQAPGVPGGKTAGAGGSLLLIGAIVAADIASAELLKRWFHARLRRARFSELSHRRSGKRAVIEPAT